MKKVITGFFLIVIFLSICFIRVENKVSASPKTYYQVYLDGEILGVVKSKEKLEKYIDDKNEEYKEKFDTNTVYSPNGLDIEKIVTYDGKIDSIEDIYEKIVDRKPFTVLGYQFTLTRTDEEDSEDGKTEEVTKTLKIYVMDKDVFADAVDNVISTFVGEDDYTAYKENKQTEIVTTGSYIDKVYVEDDITIKEVKIPVNDTIYTDSNTLAKFLLFGTTESQKKYIVQSGDTIEDVAFSNQISVQEFLISNPSFTTETALLFPGQEVVIGVTNPQINVVVESSVVEDQTKHYSTVTKYDDTLQKGYTKVEQKGVDGIERVSQKVKTVNGNITYIQPVSNTEIKASVSQIVVYGQKEVPSVGTTGNWLWPTKSGYTISSTYGWRTSPLSGTRELHTGLDIAGTGYGSPVYASNNGTVVTSGYHWSYGNWIVINHNNGYYTLYAHMSKRLKNVGDVVARGETIGLVGQTGQASGPHLHFEVWKGGPPFTGTRLNPATLKYYY